ncbi:hypothetical protein DS745_12690 [Anaerobacillus alkaliphilus]|uniref:DUF2325 domain-containing protein n=1 Tax=Anaerobacillus alkaliphilus TaxID=1548597 RepID=A0A4V1LGD5_9BACI|nr:hypothetical protein [Anaerobacillus alkaliphilus]RXJ00382.1 hypothetical protein DS745_12690 [Anaerobacillus alkaliphilus]
MVDIELLASRACVHCKSTIEARLRKVITISKDTTPWIMFYANLYELPSLTCCEVSSLPTHIAVKTDGAIDNSLFSGKTKFKVGSEEVPVIIDDVNNYAVARTFAKQMEIEQQLAKQKKLWEKQKDDFFHKTYTYFKVHFEQIIDEMDHLEVLDILRTFEDDYVLLPPQSPRRFVYKGKNERKLITKWIKKEIKSLAQAESEEVQKYLYFLIVDYFIQLKLIPQIHYLKWDPQRFEKMIGESLLTYLLVSFPLTSYFSFLKDEAILQLTNKGQFQRELRQLLERTQKELNFVTNNNQKLQQTIEDQQKKIADLEGKNEKLRLQNSRLENQLNETGDILLIGRQAQKIRELKGLVNELQEEIKELRLQKRNVEDEEVLEEEEVVSEQKEQCYDYSLLSGKTIGIFGNIQGYQTEEDQFPCRILSCESLKNPDAVSVLRESDILVVLTQHISHSCMWSIKEFANQNHLPVVYSRHTNVQIILDQVAVTAE